MILSPGLGRVGVALQYYIGKTAHARAAEAVSTTVGFYNLLRDCLEKILKLLLLSDCVDKQTDLCGEPP